MWRKIVKQSKTEENSLNFWILNKSYNKNILYKKRNETKSLLDSENKNIYNLDVLLFLTKGRKEENWQERKASFFPFQL